MSPIVITTLIILGLTVVPTVIVLILTGKTEGINKIGSVLFRLIPTIAFSINCYIFWKKTKITPNGILVDINNGVYLIAAIVWLICILAQLFRVRTNED